MPPERQLMQEQRLRDADNRVDMLWLVVGESYLTTCDQDGRLGDDYFRAQRALLEAVSRMHAIEPTADVGLTETGIVRDIEFGPDDFDVPLATDSSAEQAMARDILLDAKTNFKVAAQRWRVRQEANKIRKELVGRWLAHIITAVAIVMGAIPGALGGDDIGSYVLRAIDCPIEAPTNPATVADQTNQTDEQCEASPLLDPLMSIAGSVIAGYSSGTRISPYIRHRLVRRRAKKELWRR